MDKEIKSLIEEGIRFSKLSDKEQEDYLNQRPLIEWSERDVDDCIKINGSIAEWMKDNNFHDAQPWIDLFRSM